MSCCKSAPSVGSRFRTSSMRSIGTFEATRPRSLARFARGCRLPGNVTRDDWPAATILLGSASDDCAAKQLEYRRQTTPPVAKVSSESFHFCDMVSSGSYRRVDPPAYMSIQGKRTAEFIVSLFFGLRK